MTPASYSRASFSEVFPLPRWPTRATLRIRSAWCMPVSSPRGIQPRAYRMAQDLLLSRTCDRVATDIRPLEVQHRPMRRLTLLPLLLSLLSPAAASAFTSTITAPAAGTRLVFEHASPPTVHFAGTADSNPVDLRCVTTDAG